MHSLRTWFWIIGLTLGLGVSFAVALEINIFPWGKREQPKQDDRNTQRQTQEEFRRTGIERPEPVEKGETVIVSPEKSENGEISNANRPSAQTNPPRPEGAGSNENQPMTRSNLPRVRLNDEAIDELRLWAQEVGIKNIDGIDHAALIRLIKVKTQKTNGDGDKPLYHNEIMRIARMVGISDKQVNSLGTFALLSEICIQLDNNIVKFNNDLLNDEDLRILAICLTDDLKILTTLKKYHAFLKEIHGHKVIVFPVPPNTP